MYHCKYLFKISLTCTCITLERHIIFQITKNSLSGGIGAIKIKFISNLSYQTVIGTLQSLPLRIV